MTLSWRSLAVDATRAVTCSLASSPSRMYGAVLPSRTTLAVPCCATSVGPSPSSPGLPASQSVGPPSTVLIAREPARLACVVGARRVERLGDDQAATATAAAVAAVAALAAVSYQLAADVRDLLGADRDRAARAAATAGVQQAVLHASVLVPGPPETSIVALVSIVTLSVALMVTAAPPRPPLTAGVVPGAPGEPVSP